MKDSQIIFFAASALLAAAVAGRVETMPEYVMAINKSPSPEWVIARQADMRLADGFSFDFRVDDPGAFDAYRISFRSGEGRYFGVFEPGETGRWNRVTVLKGDMFGTQGDVAGWGDVRCVTIGGQFGLDKTPKFRIADARIVPARPEILVVRGDSSLQKFKWDRHDRLACSMEKFLRGMGVGVVLVSDMDLAKGIPETVRLVAFPSNPSIPPDAVAELARFTARGGRIFACSCVAWAVRNLLGVKTGSFYDRRKHPDEPPIDGLLATSYAPEGMPEFLGCRFDTLFEPETGPGVRPLATFADAGRRDLGIVALVQAPGGVFFSSHWKCWGRDARQLFRSVLLSVEPGWREAIDRGMAAEDRADEAYAAWFKSLKPKADEIRTVCCHNEKGYGGLGWARSVAIAKGGGYNEMIPNVAWGNCLFRREAAECLEACRAQGMKCCFWKVCWRRTPKSEQKFPGRSAKDFWGREDSSWMCPSDPLNRMSEKEQFMELARMRPDSIEFDYIRYPGGWWCACDGCRAQFEAKCGFAITNWNRQVWCDRKVKDMWYAFRREVITGFVRDVSKSIREECPSVKIYAAAISHPDTAAGWNGQDWLEWCREGIVDCAWPMDYDQGNVAGLRQLLNLQRRLGRGLKGQIRPSLGLSVWPETGRDAVRLAQEIELVRECGFDGFGVFELSGRCVGTMPALRCGIMAD